MSVGLAHALRARATDADVAALARVDGEADAALCHGEAHERGDDQAQPTLSHAIRSSHQNRPESVAVAKLGPTAGTIISAAPPSCGFLPATST